MKKQIRENIGKIVLLVTIIGLVTALIITAINLNNIKEKTMNKDYSLAVNMYFITCFKSTQGDIELCESVTEYYGKNLKALIFPYSSILK